VIEHAYSAAGGMLELHANYDARCISVTIRDHGQWRPPRDTGQGRGLELIRDFVDDVDIVHKPDGTEVRLQYLLGETSKTGSVKVLGASQPSAIETDDMVDVVRLSGEIDIANAITLFHEVIAQIRPQSVGLVIDLGQVDHIDSAGMRVLFRAARRLAPRRQSLCVVVAPGSSVHRILRLSGFDEYSHVAPTMDAAMAALLTSST
jgi:anti-anti-sigma factor